MSGLAPLFFLWLWSRGHATAEPTWPSRKHPPPRKATHPAAKRAAAKQSAAKHVARTHPAASQAAQAVHHAAAPEHAPHDHAMPVHTEHDSTERGPDLSALNFQMAPQHRPAAAHHAHVAPPPAASTADTDTAEPPAPGEGEYSVDQVQRILVSLGWRGHLTTKGALQPELTDGLFGPVTSDDWQQSARKRGLDPTFVRLGPRSVHVVPETYRTLRDVARSMGGNVVGIERGRRIFIP